MRKILYKGFGGSGFRVDQRASVFLRFDLDLPPSSHGGSRGAIHGEVVGGPMIHSRKGTKHHPDL